MKTNFKQRNNFQKSILKSAAVITSLVLLSYTVNAQGLLKELLAINSFSEIAKVLVETPSDSQRGSYSEIIEEIEEPALNIERWMVNSHIPTPHAAQYAEAAEEPLAIEGWMIEPLFNNFEEAEEAPMQLESWMVK